MKWLRRIILKLFKIKTISTGVGTFEVPTGTSHVRVICYGGGSAGSGQKSYMSPPLPPGVGPAAYGFKNGSGGSSGSEET